MALRQLAPLVLRQLPKQLAAEAPATSRSIQASAPRAYHYDYEHGPKSMDFQNWPGRKRKVATWILAMVFTGVGIPSFAVWYQQQKLKG